MTHTTPQSLLSLSPDTQSADLYAVLGLAAYESDRARIKAAADDAVSRLAMAKATSNETVWASASQWVKDAYSILGDASKKAAYDRKLAVQKGAQSPVVDPLAGLLPGSARDPLLRSGQVNHPQPSQRTTMSTIDALAQALPETTVNALQPPVPQSMPAEYQEVSRPIVTGRSLAKSRRGLPWFSILLSLFCICSLAGIGGILYLVQKDGLPSIVIRSDGITVAASADTDGDGRAVGLPGEVTPRSPRSKDPVMGRLAGDMPPPPADESSVGTDADVTHAETETMPAPETSMTNVDSPEMPMVEPSPGVPTPEMPTPEMPAPEMSAPTDEQLQAGDAAILAIVTAIKKHDWAKMKQLAADAQAAAASDQQKEQAEMLYQLTDLATYYRGGIEKSIGALQAGNELDISDDLKVVIVEAGPNKLIIRFNGKNKEYTFDTIPLTLAHKIGRLTMPGDAPTSQAAKYCYQAIAPVTTAPYREEAMAELEKITEEVEGAEPAKLVAAVRLIYQP